MLVEAETEPTDGSAGAVKSALLGEPDVSLVLPCLNEAASVGRCIDEALQTMAVAGINGEVLVVDNGSTDGSPQIAVAAGARVIREHRPGYGRAVRTGIQESRGSIVVMGDADWTYDFRKLPALIGPIRDGHADLVLGSRLEAATRKSMPILHRYIGTPLLSFLIARATGGIVVADSQTGYRAFRKEIALALGLGANGMELTSDMLIRFGRAGLRVLEVPAGYRERIGESKLNTVADGIRNLRVISLLAPQVLFLAPGVLSFFIGLLLSALAFVSPSGVAVGSLRWQPVFFSTIALVLGMDWVLMGGVLAHRSSLSSNRSHRLFRFVGERRFPIACVVAGSAIFLAGLGLDAFLFLRWLSGLVAFDRQLAFASAAQSLLIGGGSLVTFGFIVRWLYWGQAEQVA